MQVVHFQDVLQSLDGVKRPGDLRVTLVPLLHLAPVCVPALLAAATVWLLLWRISRRDWADGLLQRVAARQPDPVDLEERQLVNIVAEMAIAAGLPALDVLLIDHPGVNAAALGGPGGPATVLVTRGLLDRLDRAETSGVMAHLVASIGAGDTGLAHAVLAVFQTLGFFITFLDLPFRWSAWRTLGGLGLMSIGVESAAVRSVQVLEQLEHALDAETMPDVDRVWSAIPVRYKRLRKVLLVPLLPLVLVSLLLRAVLFLWTALFLGPPLALIWRNRRYAADAMAVQLTRYPDGLARALEYSGGFDVPPGAEGREYCFVHATASPKTRDSAARREISRSLHPSLGSRLRRLQTLGAAGENRAGNSGTVGPRAWWAAVTQHPGGTLLVGLLLLILLPLVTALILLIGYLTAIAMTLGLALGLGIVAALL